MSYNKWTGLLERKAAELLALARKANGGEHHAVFRHQPAGRSAPQLYAVARQLDGLFDPYGLPGFP